MIDIRHHNARSLREHLPRLERYVAREPQMPLSRHPAWLTVLQKGLGHVPHCLEAVEDGQTCGLLPLAYVGSWLFGRFLVGLPYLNYGGVVADNDRVAQKLVENAATLADGLKVRYLELRHEQPLACDKLGGQRSDKVNMRLALPATGEELWKRLASKVRNQIRNGQKNGLTVAWGGQDLLAEFYKVFRRNMRDLGTPVYSKKLFQSILEQFRDRAELCVVRAEGTPVAAALLLHGWGVTEVPSASSLRLYNHTCANMLMYWHLLERSIQRGQAVFDFGRASQDSNTYRFKKQWGAQPAVAGWQYYLRVGTEADMRADNPKYERLVRLWRWLPVSLTSWIGPLIVRGIP
ncbi:MAG TPA: FemAB family XrtA/PEP-CTERM system-associated protein [Gemmataceae bacterium]|nr:FemAB family XrtA/PEP-CTERM system-associated protein [Gemmataceae bacterium]